MSKLYKLVVASALILVSLMGFADSNSMPTMQKIPTQITVDYLNIKMPNGQSSMGLMGIHYDANLLPIKDFYTGVGAYGAVAGNQGGFFTLGIDNNYRPHLYGPWYLNTGFYVGGGGARSLQTGGGLMLMPYGGLGFQIGSLLLTLNYSYVTFPTGKIASSQLLFGVSIPFDLDYFASDQASYKTINFSSLHLPDDSQGVIHNFYISPMAQIYHVQAGTTNLQNQVVDRNLGLIGFEMGKYFTQNIYGAIRTLGLAHGNANGYMNVMVGPGYALALGHSPFSWVSDAMVGAGGGGQLQTKSGFLTEADTGFAWNVTSAFSPRLMVGYLVAPNGSFHTWVYTLGLNYNFGLLNSSHAGSDLADTQFNLKNWRVSVNNQTLLNPQRTNNTGNVNLIDVHLDQFLWPSYYLTYRAAFAYQGQNTGGMAEGMIGLGGQHPFFKKVIAHIALLGGAIGGGSINAGGGFIVEPEIGMSYMIKPSWGLDVSWGRMISVQKNLNSNVLTAGVSVNFGEAQKF